MKQFLNEIFPILKVVIPGIYIALIVFVFLPTPNYLIDHWQNYNGTPTISYTEPRYIVSIGSYKLLPYGTFYHSATVITIIVGLLLVGFLLRNLLKIKRKNNSDFVETVLLTIFLIIAICVIGGIASIIYWFKGPWATGSW